MPFMTRFDVHIAATTCTAHQVLTSTADINDAGPGHQCLCPAVAPVDGSSQRGVASNSFRRRSHPKYPGHSH
jgi:hypothetical protein